MAEPSRFQAWARSQLLTRLASLRAGRITVVEGDRFRSFTGGGGSGPAAVLRVRDPRVYTALALGGSIGAAESYMEGHWDCDDLTSLFRVLIRNEHLNQGIDTGLARLRAPAERLLHRLRSNTRRGSRRNIEAHYDLGNNFFRLFLDETMMYSSAVFPSPDATLEEASRHKLDLICQSLDLRPGERVVEIGTGWGGFAVHAATHYGCEVVTTTISPQQFAYTVDLVARQGLGDRITVLNRDYRDLLPEFRGGFQKAVSIEMIEAVGHRYLETYFRTCAELLEPGGRMALQAILIGDDDYERYRRSVDFIQRYIFPGGLLPCMRRLQDCLWASGMEILQARDHAPDYARTLSHWARRLDSNRQMAREMGLSEEFLRMWDYYFRYCEAGFLERHVGLSQLLIEKPRTGEEAGGSAVWSKR